MIGIGIPTGFQIADIRATTVTVPLQAPLLTPFNWVLLLLMAFGAVTFVARFALGLGASTNLSDTYPWGLWILFDLVWIAVAAGAFAMAGVIYVFQRKDLYGLGRTAVLMGLLSYSFVMVTLLADLGLPWNSYQLALQAPEHSAMFEVSWCVGLYITILLLEFLPVPFARWGYQRAADALRRWNGAYVAGAVTLVVQNEEPPYQYVVVEGTVVDTTTPAPLEAREAIAIRYLGEEGGRAFVKTLEGNPSVLFTVRPDRWITADFSGEV